MTLKARIQGRLPEMIRWRHDLHAHPETAFEERRTAAKIVDILKGFPNLEITGGLAGTGVVATLQGRHPGQGAVGLRADMDALRLVVEGDCEGLEK